jgi:hypothetical protein
LLPSIPASAVRQFSEEGVKGNQPKASEALEVVAKPQSFFVNLKNHLQPGEEAQAQQWGKRLAASVVPSGATGADRPGRPPTSKEK